tara:strand:- start:8515 stop:8745 length:231 start_codon:yes stop_codon:yes gene_type:complete
MVRALESLLDSAETRPRVPSCAILAPPRGVSPICVARIGRKSSAKVVGGGGASRPGGGGGMLPHAQSGFSAVRQRR